MRIYSIGLLCLYTAGAVIAGTETTEKAAIGYGSPEQKIAMWIWSDKYVYRPGEQLTLKWTVKTNGDLYPYTTYTYRQNNQTGAKIYLPSGTAAVPDVQPAPMKDAAKATLAAVTVPDEPGMHTLAVQLRDYTGTRVLKVAYMKISVATEQVRVTGAITANTTWVNTKSYLLNGIVTVKNGATLTIEPGTVVEGAPGSAPPCMRHRWASLTAGRKHRWGHWPSSFSSTRWRATSIAVRPRRSSAMGAPLPSPRRRSPAIPTKACPSTSGAFSICPSSMRRTW